MRACNVSVADVYALGLAAIIGSQTQQWVDAALVVGTYAVAKRLMRRDNSPCASYDDARTEHMDHEPSQPRMSCSGSSNFAWLAHGAPQSCPLTQMTGGNTIGFTGSSRRDIVFAGDTAPPPLPVFSCPAASWGPRVTRPGEQHSGPTPGDGVPVFAADPFVTWSRMHAYAGAQVATPPPVPWPLRAQRQV